MLDETRYAMRLIEWEKAKCSLRCVLYMIHDKEANLAANRLYSKFAEEFTIEMGNSN